MGAALSAAAYTLIESRAPAALLLALSTRLHRAASIRVQDLQVVFCACVYVRLCVRLCVCVCVYDSV